MYSKPEVAGMRMIVAGYSDAELVWIVQEHNALVNTNAELVEALRGCLASMERHNITRENERNDCPYDFADGFMGPMDKARAAIAKATGGES